MRIFLVSTSEAACLVLDINLPGISGLELASHLRRNGPAAIPVIFITAYDQPTYAEEARALGALAYLPKPFTGSELIGAIRRRLLPTTAPTREIGY